MILVMSTGIFTVSPIIASMPNNVVIGSSGMIRTILPLHVEGRYIKNALNQTVILRGVNKVELADDPDGIWMGATSWSDANVKAELDAMKSGGINVIRIHLSVENWKYDIGPESGQPGSRHCAISTRDAIKRLLTFAAERGIYVILDGYTVRSYWSGGTQDPMPFPPYQTSENASDVIGSVEDFVEWWRSIAIELKGYPNVIFELWNEPQAFPLDEASQDWLNASNQCIEAIREEGANQLIIFQWRMGIYCNLCEDAEGNVYAMGGEHLRDWVETAIEQLNDPLGNIVYSTHLYRSYGGTGLYQGIAQEKYGYRGWVHEHIKVAFEHMGLKWVGDTLNKPLLIGEFGADLGRTGDEYQREITAWQSVLGIFDEWGLHYQAFWWRNMGIFGLLSGGEPWVPPPTESGQILISALGSGQ